MKIGIASSGLGHIHRGMEAWASDLAAALHRRGIDVTLFKGAGLVKNEYEVVLPTLKRHSRSARFLARLTAKGGWRIGLGSPHAVESFIFGCQLLFHLRQGYDIVHVQQGSLANFLRRARKAKALKIPIIFANGQIASPDFLSQFEYVQLLTPFTESKHIKREGSAERHPKTFIIPNFIDTEVFSPGNKKRTRDKLGLPQGAFVISTVGAVNKHHKRMHYFIQETATVLRDVKCPIHVLLVGARDLDTEEITSLAEEKLGKNVSIFLDFPRERIIDIYNASDLFVLCSLKEAFGIVMIEAMACGVPVLCHDDVGFRWIVGEGGECIDMEQKGTLANSIKRYIENSSRRIEGGIHARERVTKEFSKEVIIAKVLDMYNFVLQKG